MRDMSQISPPLRIVLALAVLFGVVYMVALKPKNSATPAPAPVATPAPASASASDSNRAQTGLGKAVEAARGAAAATERAQAAGSGEAVAPQSTPATSSAATPAATSAPSTSASKPVDAALKDLPVWLQKSMDNKVVAILFTNGRSADDVRTEKALRQAYTAHGKVVTRAVNINRIARYRPVAQGVDVQQSPTLEIINRDRQAVSLVGYSDVDAINQAIIDALLATDNPVASVKYLQTVQRECKQINYTAVVGPTPGSSVKGARKNVDAIVASIGSSLGTLSNTPVPAAYRPLNKELRRWLVRSRGVFNEILSSALEGKRIDQVRYHQLTQGLDKESQRVLLDLNAVGVSACN